MGFRKAYANAEPGKNFTWNGKSYAKPASEPAKKTSGATKKTSPAKAEPKAAPKSRGGLAARSRTRAAERVAKRNQKRKEEAAKLARGKKIAADMTRDNINKRKEWRKKRATEVVAPHREEDVPLPADGRTAVTLSPRTLQFYRLDAR